MRSRGLPQLVALAFLLLIAICVSGLGAQGQAQGSETEGLQQLKDRLRQVEQETQDLKAHIDAIETKSKVTVTASSPNEPSPQPKKSTQPKASPRSRSPSLRASSSIEPSRPARVKIASAGPGVYPPSSW